MCLTCLTPAMMTSAVAEPDVFTTNAPAPGWAGGETLGGRITWTGCAGFVFEFEGTRICFDPYASNPGLLELLLRPARPDTELVERTFDAVSAVFVGHSHFDHAMDVAPLAKANSGCVVHGSDTTVELCRRQGVAEEQLQEVGDGSRVTIGPFTVEAIASAHGVVPIASRIDVIELHGDGLPRTAFRWPRGAVFAYRVEVAGRSFHLQTSAGIVDEPLERQAPADALIACLAARQGTPRYFERLGATLRPKVLVPCHHDNFTRPLSAAPRPVPQLDWPGFLGDVDSLREKYGTELVRLPRGVAATF